MTPETDAHRAPKMSRSPSAFAALAAAAGQQVDDLRETGLDAAARLSATELVWDANGNRCPHAPEVAAKRSTVQAACQ
jgi:hypothetical protein